jgi:hypothetical protein
MKKVLLSCVVLFSCLSLFAQEQRRQRSIEERVKDMTGWMKNELKLKQEQVTPVDSINLLFAKAQQLLFQASDGDRSKIRESMAGLEKEKQAALSKVLSPEQLETYKTKSQEMMQNMRRGRGQGQGN